MGDIVVTANRSGGSITTEYLTFQLPSIDFSGLFLAGASDTPIGTTAGPNDKRDYTFQAQDDKPTTNVTGATHDQLASVSQILNNSDRAPELDRTFKEMADKNITLNIRIVDTAPAHFTPDQIAGVIANLTAASSNGPDSLEAGGTADIIVVASRLDPPSGHYNFNFALSHEFGHLMRDSTGEFMKEPALDPIDDKLYQDLFKGFKARNFIESRDIAMQDHEFDQWGDTWKAFGTDGNNRIDSWQATHDEIHTGQGNDIVLSRGGSDTIYVNPIGVKFIIDYVVDPDNRLFDMGNGIAFEGILLTSLVGTRVGNDAYITYANSGVSPINDDNATIIAGYYSNPHAYGGFTYFTTDTGGYLNSSHLLGLPDGATGPIGWGRMVSGEVASSDGDSRSLAFTSSSNIPGGEILYSYQAAAGQIVYEPTTPDQAKAIALQSQGVFEFNTVGEGAVLNGDINVAEDYIYPHQSYLQIPQECLLV